MRPVFPRPIWLLLGVYFIASLAHFAHNAEFIAFYPGLPSWLTREAVYLAWLAVSAVGALAIVVGRAGYRIVSAGLLALYGCLGLDGLSHYTLALCSEHTLATNLTVWSEAASGLALLLAGSLLVKRRLEPGGCAYAVA